MPLRALTETSNFGLQRPVREMILARMAQTILASVTVGALVGIEKDDYESGLRGRYISRVVDGGKTSLAPAVGSRYSACLLRCLGGLNHWLDKNNIEGPIEYVMESGQNPQIEEEATVILSNISASEKLKKVPAWRLRF